MANTTWDDARAADTEREDAITEAASAWLLAGEGDRRDAMHVECVCGAQVHHSDVAAHVRECLALRAEVAS